MIADLTDKVTIVTGGASGIGRGISMEMASQGAIVVVADLNADGAETVAGEIEGGGGRADAIAVDVTKKDSVDAMVSRVLEAHDRIDVLVNDAGVIGAPGWWERDDGSDEDWQHTFDVNVRGLVYCSEAVAKHMVERRYGKQVNIASIAARRGGEEPYYCVSKAAVMNWTQSFAARLGQYGINVNAICPGLIWTPIFDRLAEHRSAFGLDPEIRGMQKRELFDHMVQNWIPMRREQTPEDIGKLAAFLASDDARNITGQAINVDGGIYMN